MKLKDLPQVDRPREKLLRYNTVTRLRDEELMAIILTNGTKNINVIELSKKVLKLLARDEHIGIKSLLKIGGIGISKACQIVSCIEIGQRLTNNKKSDPVISPIDVWNDLRMIRGTKKEHFYAYYLDIKNSIIKRELISLGTLSSSIAHPREIFEPAIRHVSAQIILAHNHPSGDSTPSKADIEITNRLKKAGELLDITIIDHVIVSNKDYFSMKKAGHI